MQVVHLKNTPEATEFGEITQNKGQFTPFKVIQGHFQSKANVRLVPISD